MAAPQWRILLTAALISILPGYLSAAGAAERDGPFAFGTVPLAVGQTPLDAAWRRVSSNQPAITSTVVQTERVHGLARLSFVNAQANHLISYADDTRNWRSKDYWATAAQTLAKRSGDCEDYAILKMHILRQAGVPRSDMFLVVGTDLSTRTAHAVLVVAEAGQFWVMDNLTDAVHTSADYPDFRPIMSFGANGQWVHGYALDTGPAVQRADAATAPGDMAAPAAAGSLAAVIAAQEKTILRRAG